MKEDIPVADRAKKSFSALSSVASTLNASSDNLSKNIAALEAELKKLSIGVSSSIIFDRRYPKHSMSFDNDELFYGKVSGKWCLGIETTAGHEQADDLSNHEIWPFNEAPRAKRVKAVKYIPELLDQLAKDATAMVADVDGGSEIVAKITEAISPPAPPPPNFAEKLRTVLQGPVTDEQIAQIVLPVSPSAGPKNLHFAPGLLPTTTQPVGAKKK